MKSFLIFLYVGALIGAGLGFPGGDLPWPLWIVGGILLGAVAWIIVMVVRLITAVVEKA